MRQSLRIDETVRGYIFSEVRSSRVPNNVDCLNFVLSPISGAQATNAKPFQVAEPEVM